MSDLPKNEQEEKRVSPFYKWLKRLVWTVVWIVVLLFLLLQFSSVQTYLSSKLAAYISEKTNTTIIAKKLKISPFDGIVLQELSILESGNDTIAHIGALNISLSKNLFYLLSNELNMQYLGIKGFELNVITKEGDSESNLAAFFKKLSSNKEKTGSKSSFLLDVKEIDLSNIKIQIIDENKSTRKQISLLGGAIDIEYLDFECSDFVINSIILDGPRYQNHIFQYECNIEDDLAISQSTDIKLDTESIPPTFHLSELVIRNGYFGTSNDLVLPDHNFKGYLDYNNFYFQNINVLINNLKLEPDNKITANIETLSATDNTGFVINNIKADTLLITPTSAELKSFDIEMGKTKIKDQLKFSFLDFNAFKNFAHDVVINANFKEATIQLGDLAHFVRSLSKVPFVKTNLNETINIQGRYYGKVNNLAGRGVDIKLGDKLSIAGSFNTRDLLDADNAVFNIKLDRFSTSMRKIKMIVPNFNPPQNFYKLGSINFAGRFDGYLEDFVAYGKVRTDIGSAELDMRLDIKEGSNKANYSGLLNLSNFNMGRWTDNADFGLVNFKSTVEDGRGLTLKTVKANLEASIQSLYFKKYPYKNIILDGVIDQNTFSGILKSDDENIDFVFDGTLEYLNNQAFLQFKSKIKNLDLKALNLSSTNNTFQADLDINISGSNINDFIGNLNINNLNMSIRDTAYRIDQVAIVSRDLAIGGKELMINSDLGLMKVSGLYDLPSVVNSVKSILHKNYPQVAKLQKKPLPLQTGTQKFDFSLELKNSQNFLGLLGLKNSYYTQGVIKGKVDTEKNELSIASDIPFLKIKDNTLKQINLFITSNSKNGNISIHVDSTYAIGRKFNPIDIQANIVKDTLDFELVTEKLIDSLETFDIKGRMIPDIKGYSLNLDENLMVLLGTKWKIQKNNQAIFGDQYLNFDNFILSDGYRNIEVNDINDHRGLNVEIANFDLNLINAITKYKKLRFEGGTSISARVFDVFKTEKDISAYINVPKFMINEESFGSVYIDISKPSGRPFNVNANIGEFLAFNGSYNDKLKMVDSKVKLRQAPMKIVGFLLKDGIRNTQGGIDADITFGGPTSDLKVEGTGTIHNGQTTLIYTGSTYFFDKQKLKLTNTEIDLNGAVITDMNGNKGVIRGGLKHKLFSKFGVDATLSGQNVIGLNTTKEDNPSYYGYGIGQLSADFTGPFEKVDMKITAVTGPGTKLFIPVNNSQTALSQSFIKFIKRDTTQIITKQKTKGLEGIEIQMTLTITPDAELSLIFDESKGDVIKGKGRGNMKIDITRKGDFEIFGDYEIESGQYLFTAPLILVAKPFVVERGGRIVWTGDPVNATLDITAKYRTRTSVEPFISEYLSGISQEQANLASQNTEVDVNLHLGGSLFKPEVKFGLGFPNLTGDIANFAANKLRLLQTNEQELNGQVLGLIVFNTFIQSNRISDVFGASGIQSASINTLSEFLSSQISMYITNILNSIVGDGSIISGVDFDMNVRNNNFGLTNSFLPDEIGIKNTIVFKNERLSLDVGGNYVLQFQGQQINQVLPDFALEYVLTDDRKLKVRLYGKYDIDITTTGLREKYGLGVAYRTEFGSMLDFEKSIKNAAKNVIK